MTYRFVVKPLTHWATELINSTYQHTLIYERTDTGANMYETRKNLIENCHHLLHMYSSLRMLDDQQFTGTHQIDLQMIFLYFGH